MNYDVGTRIDLRHLNKKAIPTHQKKSFKSHHFYKVGTQFIFQLTPAGLQAAIKIPVAFA